MRGGTSKAVMFLESDLPDDRSEWDAIFQTAIGSPDPNGRQLNGMGGGLSSVRRIATMPISITPSLKFPSTGTTSATARTAAICLPPSGLSRWTRGW